MPGWVRARPRGAEPSPLVHPDLRLSDFLYRYMDIEGVVATYKTRAFRMTAPQRWADPYERWWSEQLFAPGSKLVDAKAYGLCWTTRDRDEPFWRIYTCPNSTVPAIRVRTRVGTLVDRMTALMSAERGKAYLGRVRYAAAESLVQTAAGLAKGKQVSRNAATGLHGKRLQFKLEREVRLLWVATTQEDSSHYALTFDPGAFVDQVMIGPTIDPSQTAAAAQRLLVCGVPERVLCCSRLYAEPRRSARRTTPGAGSASVRIR